MFYYTLIVATSLLAVVAMASVYIGVKALNDSEAGTPTSLLSLSDGRLLISQMLGIVRRHPILCSRNIVSKQEFNNTGAVFGFANLEYLIAKLRKLNSEPPLLVGVNIGGSWLASALAQRLGMHERNVLKFNYCPVTSETNYEAPRVKGPLIVIDDICRSGKTLSYVKKYLVKKNPDREIVTMVLVQVNDKSSTRKMQVDYAAWYTHLTAMTFPWSKGGEAGIGGGISLLGAEPEDLDLVITDIDHTTYSITSK